jgi:hypothetical protein
MKNRLDERCDPPQSEDRSNQSADSSLLSACGLIACRVGKSDLSLKLAP